MSSAVSRVPAASSADALAHFEALLQFETDCWDVHHAITNERQDLCYSMFAVKPCMPKDMCHAPSACRTHA